MLFFLDPRLTGADSTDARSFLQTADARLREFHPTSLVANVDIAAATSPGPSDGVVLAIGDGSLDPSVVSFLERAVAGGAVILPVALDDAHRAPPEPIGIAQSFDVVDVLRRADHVPKRLDIAARWFAHAALARVSPTLYRGRMRLFLTYRRADGEVGAAALDKELSAQHEHVFRDLVEIQVGEPAQDVIEANLASADALVFIDTPLAGESAWVATELAIALGRGIPVVWVRIGPAEGRTPLTVQPGEAAQLTAAACEGAADLARDVLDAALDMVRLHVARNTSAFERLRSRAAEAGAEVQTLDQRRLIYAVSVDDGASPYARRHRIHIVQLYGRHPGAEDWQELQEWLAANGYLEHPTDCRGFDAAVLLRPGTAAGERLGDWSFVESGERYVSNLGRPDPLPRSTDSSPSMLLLGSFPADPRTHPGVIAAMNELSRRWLELGGAITFGGHPTFTPLLVEAARDVVGAAARSRLKVYQSGYFTTPSYLQALAQHATVVDVPSAGTLDESLTSMREAMIQPAEANLTVIIGGRTSEGGLHRPGVDEELEIVKGRGIPAFLVGEPGGQAAVIAERLTESGAWDDLGNGFSPDENQSLAWSDDYVGVADRLWKLTIER